MTIHDLIIYCVNKKGYIVKVTNYNKKKVDKWIRQGGYYISTQLVPNTNQMVIRPDGIAEMVIRPDGIAEMVIRPDGIAEMVIRPDGIAEMVIRPDGIAEMVMYTNLIRLNELVENGAQVIEFDNVERSWNKLIYCNKGKPVHSERHMPIYEYTIGHGSVIEFKININDIRDQIKMREGAYTYLTSPLKPLSGQYVVLPDGGAEMVMYTNLIRLNELVKKGAPIRKLLDNNIWE
jgi:hypothetical protein